MQNSSIVEERAKKLLGQNIAPTVVAKALGVSDGRISQLMAQEDFAHSVQELRFNALQQANILDEEYNTIEGNLLDKLKKSLPLIHRPADLLNAIRTINGAKRRGVNSPDTTDPTSQVVKLVLHSTIYQKFTVSVNNQITEVYDDSGNSQTLVTAQSASLEKLAKDFCAQKLTLPSPHERLSEDGESERSSALANSL